MGGHPLAKRDIVFEGPALCGAMADLADEADTELIATVARDGEPDRIRGSLFWQTRAGRRISEIAELAYFFGAGLDAFVAGSGALTGPSAAQRQTGRMRPKAVF